MKINSISVDVFLRETACLTKKHGMGCDIQGKRLTFAEAFKRVSKVPAPVWEGPGWTCAP